MSRKFVIGGERNEMLRFKSRIDVDGDFLVSISLDGEDWDDLLFVDCTDGKLEVLTHIDQKFKKYIALDARNAIKLGVGL